MPIEQSRAEYLQALLQQRNQLNANNNNLLNPSISNDIEQQATMNTNMQQRHNVNDIEKPQEQKQEVGSDNWFVNIVKKAEGFFDNTSHAIYEGVFGAFEGVVDLGANILGAIGEATGWYDNSGFDEFTKMNLAEYGADWMTNLQANIMGTRGFTNLITNSAKNGGDFWKDLGTGQGYKNENYDTLFGGQANRQIETGVGEFAVNLANSVGFMLPSLAVGNFAGAGTALGKLASVGAMSLAAAGKGSEEALNEGASSGQALGYGAMKGAIEGVSEYAVGAVLGTGGKVAGLIGNGSAKSVAKSLTRQVIDSFIEEGLEEVVSATFEPLAKYLTYDKSAIEQYKSTDYWFGTNGHFNESVLGQFTSGAVLGGIMSGGNAVALKRGVSAKGVTVLNKLQQCMETDSELQKARKKNNATRIVELEELSKKQSAEYLEAYKDFMDNASEKNLKRMAEALSSPKALSNMLKETAEADVNDTIKGFLDNYVKSTDTNAKRTFNNEYAKLQKEWGTNFDLKFGDVKDAKGNSQYANVDFDKKTITINENILEEKGGEVFAHEYFGHVLGQNLSAGTRTIFYNKITQDQWYKDNESDLIDAYQTNDDTYKKLKTDAEKEKYYQDEVIAYYLQDVFGQTESSKQLAHLKAVFSQPTLLDRILGVFNKTKEQFNTPKLVQEYAKTLRETVDKLHKAQKSNKILTALFKVAKGYELNESEKKYQSEYKNLFDLIKEGKQEPQVAYSKDTEQNETKQKQFDIIQKTNPMLDDYHVGIRSVNDIKTWDEVLELDDWSEGQFAWGDFTREDAEEAKKTGKITIYSSYPIKDGVFVSTSYQQAYEYAGHNKNAIYSKTVDLVDVAWINGDEGQFAKTSNDIRYSKELNNNNNKSNKPAPTYKSMKTIRDILDITKAKVENNTYHLVYPKSYNNFINKTFTEINSRVKPENQVNKLVELLKTTTLEQFNEETQSYEEIGTLGDIYTDEEIDDLKQALKTIIETSKNTTAKSRETLPFEKQLNKMTDKANEYGARIGRVRVLNNKLNSIDKKLLKFTEVTEDNIARNGLNTLLEPFTKLKGTDKGYSSILKADRTELRNALNKTLEWYNPQNIQENFETLPYDEEIRNSLEELYEMLGKAVEKTDANGKVIKYGANLSTDEVNKIIDTMNLIEQTISNNTRDSINNKTYAQSTMAKVNGRTLNKGISRLIRAWKRGFAPSYTELRTLLGGNTPLARLLTTDVQKAHNNSLLYKGAYFDALKKKMKELGIKDKHLNKMITVNGVELTTDQAIYLYISLNTDANFKAIDESGFEYKTKDNLSQTYGKGQAQEFKTAVESALDESSRKLGDYLLEVINSGIKSDYIKWYESRYGKFAGRNEIGKIGDKTYWMLNRSYQYGTSAEKVIKVPNGVFKHSISRTGDTNNAILINNAVSSYTTYIEQLANEIYMKPIYRQAYQVLNTKVNGTTLFKVLQQYSFKDNEYFKNTLNDIIGGLDSKQDMLSRMMGAFTVAKLSLNIGSMLKQLASIATSNIPLHKSVKAVFTKMFSREARKEYRQLVDEIGGVKYRSSSGAVIQANAGTLKGFAEKVAEKGMLGIKGFDLVAISVGVYSLMQIGQDQFGFKIGSQENMDFVKDHWTEFELSQIGNSALSKSGLSRGDYNVLARAIFSFMQGANRAAFGSQINKIGLWQRNHKYTKEQIAKMKQSITDLKSEIDEIKNNNLDANGNFDELNLDEETRNKYINKQSELLSLQDTMRDYDEYKIAGGKMIPMHMVSGIVAQGIFVAFINELMKHIRGRKDWDDWDITTLGLNTLLTTFAEWVPFVNTVEQALVGNFEKDNEGNIKLGKGYEVQIPALEVINEMVDIINTAKDGEWNTMLRKLMMLLGDTTGIPFKMLYEYAYGTIKAFNPEIAYNMNNVFYGNSLSTATQTLNKYVEKGDATNVQAMVNVIMSSFKVKSSETINKEIAKLYANGYNEVMPRTPMTYYTDDNGNQVNFNSKQIAQFQSCYNESSSVIESLLKITDYKKATNEEQAKIIKKIYDAYYSYAKAKTLNLKADSKLGSYLLFSKKNVKISQFMPVLQRVSTITDSKIKTRKELVFDYINKLSGFTRAEKLLLLYFSGYSSVKSDNTLTNYLRNNLGFTNKEVKEFLG